MEDARSHPVRNGDALTRHPPLVGRAGELATLTELADRSVEEGAQFVFVSGEAGIGKSSVIDHATRELADARWAVHTGHCIEYAQRTHALDAVIQIVRSVVADAGRDGGDGAIEALVGHHRADLSALLPELRADWVDGASLAGDVDRLNDAIANVLVRASERRPMAVVVEDVHWADTATRDLLASLVHSLTGARILVLVSERTGAVPKGHAFHTWSAEIRRFPNVTTMVLTGLDEPALAEQATNILGTAIGPAELAELAERTGGNAYFAHELLLARRAGSDALPPSLADFLVSRIRRLDPDEQQLLRALAVAGRPLHHRVLTEILPDLDVSAVVRRLFDASIIVADGSDLGFDHALMREAMLHDVLPFDAEDLHCRLAQATARRLGPSPSPADLAMLATHWRGANDPERSIESSVAAAEAAAGVAAFSAAADFGRTALSTWWSVPDPEHVAGMTRDHLVIQTSDWLVASHELGAAADLLADAVEGSDESIGPGRRALLLAKLAPIRFEMGQPAVANTLIDQAVILVGDEISAEAALVHHRAAKLALLSGSIHPAIAAAERAMAIAEVSGPEVVLVEAMTTLALGFGVTESLDAGLDLIRRARQRAVEQNLPAQVAFSYRTEMIIINHRLGRTEAGLEALRQGLAYAEQHCGPNLRLDLRQALALALVESGRLVEAGPVIEDALAAPAVGLRRLAVLHAAALHRVLTAELDEAAEFVAMAKELSDRFHSAQETGFQHRIAAELARRRGQFDDALEHIDAALALQVDSDNISYTRESILEKCRLVAALSDSGDRRARVARTEVEPLVERMAAADAGTAVWSDLMRLELRAAEGAASAAEATAVLDRLAVFGFGAEALQASLLHAELAAAEADRPDDVVDVLLRLRNLGASSGMTWLIEGADRITDRLGLAIDLTSTIDLDDGADAPPDDHGLTGREIEVLELLAQGLTNKEIGAELYVSHRTISTHVSNLLAKLHLKNRSEAAAAYHRLGFARSTD